MTPREPLSTRQSHSHSLLKWLCLDSHIPSSQWLGIFLHSHNSIEECDWQISSHDCYPTLLKRIFFHKSKLKKRWVSGQTWLEAGGLLAVLLSLVANLIFGLETTLLTAFLLASSSLFLDVIEVQKWWSTEGSNFQQSSLLTILCWRQFLQLMMPFVK